MTDGSVPEDGGLQDDGLQDDGREGEDSGPVMAAQPGAESAAVPQRPAPTGDPRVDDAVSRLDDLDSAPTSEHVAIVEDVHRRLQDALGDPAPEIRSGS